MRKSELKKLVEQRNLLQNRLKKCHKKEIAKINEELRVLEHRYFHETGERLQ